jgi:uridylate kinase
VRVVLRIGGSVIASPINPDLIKKYAELLDELQRQKHEIAVVVGGGKLAREFISIAKSLGLDEKAQDDMAISVSRLFAQLFLRKLQGRGCSNVPVTADEAAKCLALGKIVVMGGLRPGMTTDTVAALVAETIKADLLVKATDQDGVYDKDPRKHVDAVKLNHLRHTDLSTVFSENKHRAGIHQIIDPEAIKILSRYGAKLVVVNGFEPRNVATAIRGESVGTLVD